MDDAELVRATYGGDISAFTAIFDRYAARVHDVALATLRDRSQALEVVQSTFLEAALRLHGLLEHHRLAVWLLAVTRRNAVLRAGPRAGLERQPAFPDDDPERVRLAGLIWEAVADLPMRERTLIDLDLRQGLDGQDLADALGVTIAQAHGLQARLRDRIEKGLSGYLIARTSEGRCPGLTKLLKGWDGRFTPQDSSRIARHVERCQVCNQIRFGLPSPFALYAAALPAPFPAAVRPRVLDQVVLPVPAGVAPSTAEPLFSAPPVDPETIAYQYPMVPPPPPTPLPMPESSAFGPPPEAEPSPPAEPDPAPPVKDPEARPDEPAPPAATPEESV